MAPIESATSSLEDTSDLPPSKIASNNMSVTPITPHNATTEASTLAKTSLWDDPMVKYFGITGILAAICVVLLFIHIYISFAETKRERMAQLKNNGPGMVNVAKVTGGGGGVSGSKPSTKKTGFMIKFNR